MLAQNLELKNLDLPTVGDPSSQSNPEIFELTHVEFDWTIDFFAKFFSGRVELYFMRRSFPVAEHDTLKLDIKDIEVFRILINNEPTEFYVHSGQFPILGNVLEFKVGQTQSKFTVIIEYRTTPQCSALQWLDQQMTADKKHPFVFSLCQKINARSLFPCQDTPSVKFTFKARVIAPPQLTVLMGAQHSVPPCQDGSSKKASIHHFQQDFPIPSYLVAIACGGLKHARIGQRSVVWAEPSVLSWAQSEFNDVDKMLEAAESLCGKYVWGAYDLLMLPPSFPYGGMENPCLTFIPPYLLAGDKLLTSVIAHEIAHSWTGNLVTNANWEHFWLNEGHAEYLEALIMECVHGTDYRDLMIELDYEDLLICLEDLKEDNPLTKMIPALTGVHPEDSPSTISYKKGSLFLYFLENKYGKEAILSWLKSYLSHFRGRSLTTQEWIEFFDDHLGTNILREIDCDTWFYGAGQIPWVPKSNRKLSSVVDQVAEKIKSTSLGSDSTSACYIREQYQEMLPLQRQLLWQRILKYAPLSHDNLIVLNSMLAVSTAKNAEIRYRWSLIVLYSQFLPGVEGALEFLNSQGRIYYTIPIYKALLTWPAIRQQAINNYKANKQYMHPATASLVEKTIG